MTSFATCGHGRVRVDYINPYSSRTDTALGQDLHVLNTALFLPLLQRNRSPLEARPLDDTMTNKYVDYLPDYNRRDFGMSRISCCSDFSCLHVCMFVFLMFILARDPEKLMSLHTQVTLISTPCILAATHVPMYNYTLAGRRIWSCSRAFASS